MSAEYVITTNGCDDVTIATVALTPDQAEGVRIAAEAVTEASEYDCMPRLSIRPAPSAREDGPA